jgi:hypothetical protein
LRSIKIGFSADGAAKVEKIRNRNSKPLFEVEENVTT